MHKNRYEYMLLWVLYTDCFWCMIELPTNSVNHFTLKRVQKKFFYKLAGADPGAHAGKGPISRAKIVIFYDKIPYFSHGKCSFLPKSRAHKERNGTQSTNMSSWRTKLGTTGAKLPPIFFGFGHPPRKILDPSLQKVSQMTSFRLF